MNITISTIKLLLLASLLAGILTSCDDWLDVSPKSQISTDLQFSRESGFRDQLTGVYTQMCGRSMYGGEMSMALVEVLAQSYDLTSSSSYRYAQQYNYAESTTKAKIDTIWSSTYNCIANLNVVLQKIDEVDQTIFTGNNYYLCKGEALGLRAFLYLDLMRLFVPSPASDGNSMGVPYVTTYGTDVTPRVSVNETMKLIVTDLKESIELLKHDSLYSSLKPHTFANRRKYFNYYAAEATLARACMYMGNKAEALAACEEIIKTDELKDSYPFYWTHYTAIETTYDSECDRHFSSEEIFHLYINDLSDIADSHFNSNAGLEYLSPSDTKADEMFEKTAKGYGNDYRMLKGFAYDGATKYLCKFWQYTNGTFNKYYPLIRQTEAFYIAAEILKESNPTRAIELINKVRSNRNLGAYALPSTLSSNEIQGEIFKEYRKEFLGEGQLFFYYKRLNLSEIKGAAVNASDRIYVLPMPDVEIEYGDR